MRIVNWVDFIASAKLMRLSFLSLFADSGWGGEWFGSDLAALIYLVSTVDVP